MARSKKNQLKRGLARAASRDRKRSSQNKMRVSGKGVFILARLQGGPRDSKKS
jgi:hypothetical protein